MNFQIPMIEGKSSISFSIPFGLYGEFRHVRVLGDLGTSCLVRLNYQSCVFYEHQATPEKGQVIFTLPKPMEFCALEQLSVDVESNSGKTIYNSRAGGGVRIELYSAADEKARLVPFLRTQ